MRDLLYRWVSPNVCPPRWMGFVFKSCERCYDCLYVAFPLNFLVVALWWLQDRWARTANAPSWIEDEIKRRRDDHAYDRTFR